MLYPLAGIAPPSVRRDVTCAMEKARQTDDLRHPLYGHKIPRARLKSRKSFMRVTQAAQDHPTVMKSDKWKEFHPPPPGFITPQEHLPPGHDLPWSVWKSINRLRTQVGRCRQNLCKWGMRDSCRTECDCGAPMQSMLHLLSCPLCPTTCTRDDLIKATPNAIEVAKYYQNI